MLARYVHTISHLLLRCVTVYLELGRSNAFKPVRQKASLFGPVEANQLIQSEKIEVTTASQDNELLLTRQTTNKVESNRKASFRIISGKNGNASQILCPSVFASRGN